MFTKPSSRRLARLIAGAAAALISLVIVILMAPATPQSRLAAALHLASEPSNNLSLGAAVSADQLPAEPIDHQVRQAGGDQSWWQAVSAQIEGQEYAALPTPHGLQAPNRAHNLRTTYAARGIEVVPRTGKSTSPAWRFGWETTGFGRPGRTEEVPPSTPSVGGARVVYQRHGWSEWYENRKDGLEQGFMIDERPAGRGQLTITGTIGGGLRPELREDGDVDLLNAQGACVLRYGKLQVWDADGQQVDSRLAVEGTELAILVDDLGAAYPLVIDPLMTSPAWTAEGNQIAANLGSSVATAGDVNGDGFSDVIVGAPYYDNGQEDEGRAFVYHGSPAGLAASPAWTAEADQVFASLGNSVAPAGDVNGDGYSDVIVCALYYDNNAGKAFVYQGSSTGLAAVPTWTAQSDQATLQFAVGTAGDVNADGFSDVIVGIADYDNGQSDEGRAMVYHGSAAGLVATPAWTTESNQASAEFGRSVAAAGDVNGDGFADVIIGAWQYDNGEVNEGRAFIYHGSGSGLVSAPAATVESNRQAAYFGSSVAMAGDVNGDGFSDVIVGAYRWSNPEGWEGGAFAYHGSSTGITLSPAWTAESNQIGAELGNAVATAGDVNGDGFADVIVGAWQYDNGQNNEGRAFVYHGSPAGLSASSAWAAEVDQGSFGYAVATAGDVNGDGFSDVIVGAPGYANGQAAEGRGYVYLGAAAGLASILAWTEEPDQVDAHFGVSVATAGDVNGDGFSDVIVGADEYDNGEFNEGRAYLYHGVAGGLTHAPRWTAESNQDFGSFGASVATAGDVNGDGFSDVIVGAKHYDNGENDEGRAFVFHGAAAGLSSTPAWTAESNQTGSGFGVSVATAGDVNGDGFSDVIVGAKHYDNGENDEGRAFVYHGSAAGLSSTPAWTAESNQADAFFGVSVATAGDVNGDGFSDVIIGAEQYDNGESTEGRAFVYHGSAAGLAPAPAWTAESNQVDAFFGVSVATAGDVNGDGFSDVIVGAASYSNGESDEGRVFTYYGSAVGLDPTAAWTAESNQTGSGFGVSVATAGDVNGDGFSDVIVGAQGYGQDGEGRAFAYHGSAAGLATTPTWTAEPYQVSALFGVSVATAGDVNGDGFSDVIVGALVYDNGEGNEGRAFVYFGNGGDGLNRIPRQARNDDSALISLLGNSDSESSFRLKALGRTAVGRGDVRLQFEVKPGGVPFDGTGLVTGLATNTGLPIGAGSVVPLSQLASGLTPETLYHWRLRIASDSPFFPRSPWMWLPYNAATEADMRTAQPSTAVHEQELPQVGLWLAPSAPNPFNPRTTIAYVLPARMPARLTIHDVQGRLVRMLVDEVQPAGHYEVEWEARDGKGNELATGIYFSRLEAGGQAQSRKLALVK